MLWRKNSVVEYKSPCPTALKQNETWSTTDADCPIFGRRAFIYYDDPFTHNRTTHNHKPRWQISLLESVLKCRSPTFFWRSLMANFSLFRCILSPCSKAGPVGSWFSRTSNSYELLVWSRRAVAKSWHCFLSSWYSFLNSCSKKLNLKQN